VLGREAVLGLVSRWAPPPGGVKVAFVGVGFTQADGRWLVSSVRAEDTLTR
jgi:hypothetical protein